MMSATHFTARALGNEAPPGEAQACGLCGQGAPGKPSRQALKTSFTNLDELHSDWVCWACEACLNDRRTRSSVVAFGGEFRKLIRAEIWPLLLDPPEPPFVLYLTRQGKKHGLFRQAVAGSREQFQLQCEELSALFRPRRYRGWMRLCAEMASAGCKRAELEVGRYSSWSYMKVGPDRLLAAEGVLREQRGSSKWDIVFGLMPSLDVLEELHAEKMFE